MADFKSDPCKRSKFVLGTRVTRENKPRQEIYLTGSKDE